MFDTILQSFMMNNFNTNVPINGDVMAIGSYYFFRYGTNWAKRFLRKVEKIVLFYLFIFVGYELYMFLK